MSDEAGAERVRMAEYDYQCAAGSSFHYNTQKIKNGECSRCGECCRWLIFPIAPGGMEFDEFYIAHGCKIDSRVGLMVKSICQHLKKENVPGNVYSCDIYETRPLLCRKENRIGLIRGYRHEGCTDA